MTALDTRRSHFDLLHQLLLVGIDGIEAIDLMMLIDMGRGISQGAKRIHLVEGFLAPPLQTAIHTLRLINNQDGPRRANQVDGLFAARLLAVLVEVIHVLLVDGPDCDDHDLNVLAGREVSDLSEFPRVIEEVVERHARIQAAEMVCRDLQRLIDAFLDGDRGNDNHKLGEAVSLVQLEHGAKIDIGLARARFHFNGEIARGQ